MQDKVQLQHEKKKVKDLEEKIAQCRAQLEKQPESLREQLRKQIQEVSEGPNGHNYFAIANTVGHCISKPELCMQ